MFSLSVSILQRNPVCCFSRSSSSSQTVGHYPARKCVVFTFADFLFAKTWFSSRIMFGITTISQRLVVIGNTKFTWMLAWFQNVYIYIYKNIQVQFADVDTKHSKKIKILKLQKLRVHLFQLSLMRPDLVQFSWNAAPFNSWNRIYVYISIFLNKGSIEFTTLLLLVCQLQCLPV